MFHGGNGFTEETDYYSQQETVEASPATPAGAGYRLSTAPSTQYQVYLDGFATKAAAAKKADAIKAMGGDAFVTTSRGRFIVKLGTFRNPQAAQQVASRYGAKVREL